MDNHPKEVKNRSTIPIIHNFAFVIDLSLSLKDKGTLKRQKFQWKPLQNGCIFPGIKQVKMISCDLHVAFMYIGTCYLIDYDKSEKL